MARKSSGKPGKNVRDLPAAKSGQAVKNLRWKKLNAREAATVRGGSTGNEPGTLKRL